MSVCTQEGQGQEGGGRVRADMTVPGSSLRTLATLEQLPVLLTDCLPLPASLLPPFSASLPVPLGREPRAS